MKKKDLLTPVRLGNQNSAGHTTANEQMAKTPARHTLENNETGSPRIVDTDQLPEAKGAIAANR